MKNITFLLVLFSSITFAQKNSPVAGQAARLVDLLKKDYSAVNVIDRAETLSRDMDEAIAIFMVYSNNINDKANFINEITLKKTALTDYQEALDNYTNLNKGVSGLNISNTTAPGVYSDLKGVSDNVATKKKEYYKTKISFNITILVGLRNHFKKNNEYLSYMADLFFLKYTSVDAMSFDKFASANYTSSIQKALPFFGGDLAFSEAIDGLSRFLAKRIKDELTVYAVQKVQEYLNNPKPESYLNELMVLLPTTTSYLKSFDSSRTLNFIDDLKQYIEQDLNNLILNASALKNTPRFKKYIEQNPDLDFAFEALELFPQLSKIENPIDYFDMLENSRNIQRWASSSNENIFQSDAAVNLMEKYIIYNLESDQQKKPLAKETLDQVITHSQFLNNYTNLKTVLKDFRETQMKDYLTDANSIKELSESTTLEKLSKLQDIKVLSSETFVILDPVYITNLNNALSELERNKKIIADKKVAIFKSIAIISSEKDKITKIALPKLSHALTNIFTDFNTRQFEDILADIKVLNDDLTQQEKDSKDVVINLQIKILTDNYTELRKIIFGNLKTFIDATEVEKTDYKSFSVKPEYELIVKVELLNAESKMDDPSIDKILKIKFKDVIKNYKDVISDNKNQAYYKSLKSSISQFRKLNPFKTTQYNIANSIKFASMLAHSLMIVEDSKPKFANTAFMSGYSSEINFYLLYIGFLQQQNKNYYNISFYLDDKNNDLDFLPLMTKFPAESVSQKATEFKAISGSLTKIAENAEKLHNNLLKIKKANSAGEKVTATDFHDLAGDIIDFSEDVFFAADTLINTPSLSLLPTANISSLLKKTAPYITTARTVNDIFLDLHTKNYTTAIIKAIEIPSAFGKNNEQYEVYANIVNITNGLKNMQKANNLKNLFAYDRIYTSNEKKQEQKDLANWIQVSFESDPDFTDFLENFNTVYTIINKSDGNLTTELKALKPKLNDTVFYRKYLNIDIHKINKKIKGYLTLKGISETSINKINDDINSLIKESISAYVFNVKEDEKSLDDKRKKLLLNLKYYLPEMFPDIFQFKDENTVKLIHFVNDVANAGNAEDVEKALNSFALPPGSSSLKEQAKTYFSVNAYPGIFGGFTTTSITKGDSYNVGFTAPVGLYGQLWTTDIGTIGLFLPLIDIAAPIRLRLSDNTQKLPDLEFKDVFTPGLFLSYGFNKMPFAINLGGQFGPSLKSISDEGSETGENQKVIEKQAFYWSIAFTIDIPLFTIHAKSKN